MNSESVQLEDERGMDSPSNHAQVSSPTNHLVAPTTNNPPSNERRCLDKFPLDVSSATIPSTRHSTAWNASKNTDCTTTDGLGSTTNNPAGSSLSTDDRHSLDSKPSTTSSTIPSTNKELSASIPPPTPASEKLRNVDSPSSAIDASPASIKVIDFGYAASSPLHRPVWAPPLDEQSEDEEFEEFDDESDEEEGEEGELEPGLYRAVYAFEAEGASEMSLDRGQVVRVVGRGGGVGWAVVLDEGEGKKRHALVPESYLVREE